MNYMILIVLNVALFDIYRYDILIVDISTLLKNIDIDIDMVIFENIDIDKAIPKISISISIR